MNCTKDSFLYVGEGDTGRAVISSDDDYQRGEVSSRIVAVF